MTRGVDQRAVRPSSPSDAARRAAVIETLIPATPSDIAPLRIAFSRTVSRQWEAHVPITHAQSAKARFIAEMYARACYSMLLVSAGGPAALRLPVRAAAMLPLPRGLAIGLGSALLTGLNWLVPRGVHRQLLLTSALMGMLDVVLDETASSGEAAVLRFASLITRNAPASLSAEEPL